MATFRFRAEAALDVRRKQEDEARRVLAAAQTAHEAAQARAVAADLAACDAASAFTAEQRRGTAAWRLGWHQSWITRLRLEADACQRATAISAGQVERATASVKVAHQRRRTMERLRDRARTRFDLAATRQDMRDMNAVAGLRFAAQAAERGGLNGDDRSNGELDEPNAHV